MKKKFIMFFSVAMLLLATACSNQYEPEQQISNTSDIKSDISLEDARQELEVLLDDVYGKQSTRANEHGGKTIISATTFKEGRSSNTRSASHDSLTYHVFNFANNGGYAIMSGDSEMPSLLALTESGNFVFVGGNGGNGNTGVDIFLQNMSNLPKNLGNEDTYTSNGAWTNTVYKVGGYCPVKWGQGSPYNKFCPVLNDTVAPTGCVATAVAQLMATYHYPSSYAGYTFDWNGMTASPYIKDCANNTQTQCARLMQLLGLPQHLDMQYSTTSSGANPEKIPMTLRNFGFSNGGQLVEYTTNAVRDELIQGHCVLVGGQSFKQDIIVDNWTRTQYAGGHRWLCHGLLCRHRTVYTYRTVDHALIGNHEETYWYPLCNWGWDGNSDGYFLSNVFDAVNGPKFDSTTRSDTVITGHRGHYQYKINAIIGIRK